MSDDKDWIIEGLQKRIEELVQQNATFSDNLCLRLDAERHSKELEQQLACMTAMHGQFITLSEREAVKSRDLEACTRIGKEYQKFLDIIQTKAMKLDGVQAHLLQMQAHLQDHNDYHLGLTEGVKAGVVLLQHMRTLYLALTKLVEKREQTVGSKDHPRMAGSDGRYASALEALESIPQEVMTSMLLAPVEPQQTKLTTREDSVLDLAYDAGWRAHIDMEDGTDIDVNDDRKKRDLAKLLATATTVKS